MSFTYYRVRTGWFCYEQTILFAIWIHVFTSKTEFSNNYRTHYHTERVMLENISLPTNVIYIYIYRKNPMNPQCGCILTNGYVNCTDRFFPTASNNGFSQLYSIYTAPLSLSDTLLCTAKSIHLCTHSFSYLNLFLTNLSRSLVYSPLHSCE